MTEQAPPTPPVPDRRLFPVVTLLRDEVTGQLALQVGQRVYQRDGQPCPVCGTTIRRIVVGQRGTHYCPTCQPRRRR